MEYGIIISFVIYGHLFSVIRLCKETPTAGGRLFEMGDEELLRFAHLNQGAFLSSLLNSLRLTSDYQLISSDCDRVYSVR